MRISKLTGAVAVAAAATLVSTASADDLVIVDLSVENEITITATDGLSAATASGPNSTGFLLADFHITPPVDSVITSTGGVGDFTTAENPSDGSPGIFSSTTNVGLNFWSFSTDGTVTVTAGEIAFTGAATFTVTPTEYADLLNSNASGDIYFPADTDDDIASATLLGTWNTSVIPEPASLGLLSMAGLGLVRRRRA